MIKIIVTDDHPFIREGIKQIVARDKGGIEVVGEASNGADLLKLLESETPDLIILDISMPVKNGLDTLKELKTFYNRIPVLILSMHPEERYAVRAFKGGASGYLLKNSIIDELINAIRMIVDQQKRYVSQSVADQLVRQLDSSYHSKIHDSLTDREYQVLCMIASGRKIRDIADELSLSDQTIHTYRSRLKEKLNLSSNVEFTLYAVQNNLID